MRLVLDVNSPLHAEYVCHTARDGQRVLNEHPISAMYIGSQLRGRGTSLDVLKWANQRGLLPMQITLVSNNLEIRRMLGEFLTNNGYVGDGIFFHKTMH